MAHVAVVAPAGAAAAMALVGAVAALALTAVAAVALVLAAPKGPSGALLPSPNLAAAAACHPPALAAPGGVQRVQDPWIQFRVDSWRV